MEVKDEREIRVYDCRPVVFGIAAEFRWMQQQ